MSTMLTVPAPLVEHLRTGLHSEIGTAAEDISKIVSRSCREQHPDWYREPLGRFDRARSLLNLIGWGEIHPPVEVRVDLDRHRRALAEALAVALATGQDDLQEAEETDAQSHKRGGSRKHVTASKHIVALQALIEEVEADRKQGGSR